MLTLCNTWFNIKVWNHVIRLYLTPVCGPIRGQQTPVATDHGVEQQFYPDKTNSVHQFRQNKLVTDKQNENNCVVVWTNLTYVIKVQGGVEARGSYILDYGLFFSSGLFERGLF